jgi:hypothetical protein
MVTGQRPVSPCSRDSIPGPDALLAASRRREPGLQYFLTDETNLNLLARHLPQMKNPYDVLRMKEQELTRVRKEMEALRVAARLLGAEDPGAAKGDSQPQLPRVVEMP